MIKKALIKTKGELQENGGYEDAAGDMWKNKKSFIDWDKTPADISSLYCVYREDFNTVVDFSTEVNVGLDYSEGRQGWAFKEIYTKETHPEYYL